MTALAGTEFVAAISCGAEGAIDARDWMVDVSSDRLSRRRVLPERPGATRQARLDGFPNRPTRRSSRPQKW